MLKIVKKYGKVVLLFAIFFILMEATFIINRLIDGTLEKNETETTIQKLQETADKSGAKEKGLNEYQVIWDYDIRLLKEEYPDKNEILFEYIDSKTWETELDTLVEEVNSKLLTDEEILGKVKKIIPERFHSNAFKDYLLSMKILNPDIFKTESSN